MRKAIIWASLSIGVLLSCSPLNAQQFWYIPHIDEARTPIEVELQSGELQMPGFGIGSTRAMLIKRFQYALDHKWLAPGQVDQLCNDLKHITDREQGQRDASGKLSFESRSSLAKQLAELNDRFEDMVLVREQSSPGLDGIVARRAMMVQKINKSVGSGRLSARKATELKAQIATATAEITPELKEMNDAQAKKIAGNLNQINTEMDRELSLYLRPPSLTAARPAPFSR